MAEDKGIKSRPTSPGDIRCPDCNWPMIVVTDVGAICNNKGCKNKAKPSRM